MNEHVERIEEVLDMAHGADTASDGVVYVQDDSDYPVDPLDDFEINAFGSASALDKAEGKVGAEVGQG